MWYNFIGRGQSRVVSVWPMEQGERQFESASNRRLETDIIASDEWAEIGARHPLLRGTHASGVAAADALEATSTRP